MTGMAAVLLKALGDESLVANEFDLVATWMKDNESKLQLSANTLDKDLTLRIEYIFDDVLNQMLDQARDRVPDLDTIDTSVIRRGFYLRNSNTRHTILHIGTDKQQQ